MHVVDQVLRNLRDSPSGASPTVPLPVRAAAAAPRGEDPLMLDELSCLIEAKMAEYRTTGVAFGICRDGSAACRAFGITNVDNPQPVTTDTVFPSKLSPPSAW